ncbi:MAG: GlmL-related ornithine degradation protein [Bacteroidota bacterium]|nr:GlmL-related ornithine degradation protein [Bacteroidota bacterium]
MHVDVLVAEIGSTTTIVNAFSNIGHKSNENDYPDPVFVGQGQAPTSVLQGDVTLGLNGAVEDLKNNLGQTDLSWNEMFATSSAAGGLRMSVHGLVYDMTVRAAKEAALGAGAIVKYVTAGQMRRTDLLKLKEISPNIILLAGGVDFGERNTALYNFEQIASLNLNAPVIYAGNIENHDEIKLLADEFGIQIYIVENVYPKIDLLNVEPARKIIQDVFEEHIVHAPGMSKVRQLVKGPIIPTPGSVMIAAKLLKDLIGDLVVFDIGGATTDVHSVTSGSEEISRILVNPEPTAKRTVEGDLGVFVNLIHVVEKIGESELINEFPELNELIENARPIPRTQREISFIERLTKEALVTSLERHAGTLRTLYGLTGKRTLAEGKDLTNVKYIIGTGGALTRLPKRKEILKEATSLNNSERLFPRKDASVLIDNSYIMASLGVLSKKYPSDAIKLMKRTLELS